jgi:hypothetical protein
LCRIGLRRRPRTRTSSTPRPSPYSGVAKHHATVASKTQEPSRNA